LILLSLGTQQPFPRALDLVEPLARQGRHLIVQHGSTVPRPDMPNSTWVEFMPFAELVDTMAKVESVVCHAGVGTIMTALQAGHTPVVIPRQARYDEHVDDHQLDIATNFEQRGLVRRVTSETDLAPLLTPRNDSGRRPIGRGSLGLRVAVSGAVAAKPRGRLRSRPRGAPRAEGSSDRLSRL
jgi:UDP-N-acetylglucosamine--N-acetylmuramyl-(pentapeptide) pyrophosphoryl-undecaprenol N-acetylglucosamine transferase